MYCYQSTFRLLTPGNKSTLSGLIIGGQLTVSETTPIDAKIRCQTLDVMYFLTQQFLPLSTTKKDLG